MSKHKRAKGKRADKIMPDSVFCCKKNPNYPHRTSRDITAIFSWEDCPVHKHTFGKAAPIETYCCDRHPNFPGYARWTGKILKGANCANHGALSWVDLEKQDSRAIPFVGQSGNPRQTDDLSVTLLCCNRHPDYKTRSDGRIRHYRVNCPDHGTKGETDERKPCTVYMKKDPVKSALEQLKGAAKGYENKYGGVAGKVEAANQRIDPRGPMPPNVPSDLEMYVKRLGEALQTDSVYHAPNWAFYFALAHTFNIPLTPAWQMFVNQNPWAMQLAANWQNTTRMTAAIALEQDLQILLGDELVSYAGAAVKLKEELSLLQKAAQGNENRMYMQGWRDCHDAVSRAVMEKARVPDVEKSRYLHDKAKEKSAIEAQYLNDKDKECE